MKVIGQGNNNTVYRVSPQCVLRVSKHTDALSLHYLRVTEAFKQHLQASSQLGRWTSYAFEKETEGQYAMPNFLTESPTEFTFELKPKYAFMEPVGNSGKTLIDKFHTI